jgi:hypothetical protein
LTETTADWIVAVASIVNAISVVILVRITSRYAESTQQILEESRKSREAAEKQAAAAQANIDFLQHQIETQAGLGRMMVQSAIESRITSITYWRSLPLSDLSRATSLPNPNDLLPANLSSALEHARGISPTIGQLFSEAVDNLRIAKNEIERAKNVNAAIKSGFYIDKGSQADGFLANALGKFQEAQKTLSSLRRPEERAG